MGTPRTCKWKKAVIKTLLGTAFLLVLMPQLSYKFYLCANNPSWTFRTQSLARISHEKPAAGNIAFEHCRPLSIDKRYCPKHLDVLSPLEIGFISEQSCDAAFVMCPACKLSFLPGFSYALRGPPTPFFS